MRYLLLWPVVVLMGCASGTHTHEGNDHDHQGHNHETEITETAHPADEIIFTPEQAEAAGLVVETIEPSDFQQIIKTAGQIESPSGEEAIVVATSTGIVSFAAALTEGSAVRKGQIVATISARNMVDGDPAARARIKLEAAEREYRRAEALVADQIVSQKAFEEARRRYDAARAALPATATPHGVAVAAPLTGYVRERFVAPGEYVALGQPIAAITQNNTLQLRAEVSERHFAQLPTLREANFKLAAGEAIFHTDRLISYGKSAEGGYIPVLFEFTNTGGVMPGAYAEVWLLGAPEPDVLSVPKSALTEEQGLFFVYLQLDEEGYRKQEVRLGPDDGERVSIRSGLAAGDRVVARGAVQIRLAATSSVIPEGHTH